MNKAPASLQQLTVVSAVALVHAAGLWALLDPTLQPAASAPAPQVAMVTLLSEAAAVSAPPAVQQPLQARAAPRAATPAPPKRQPRPPLPQPSPPLPQPSPPLPPSAIAAVPVAAAEPVSTERPLPSSETAAAVAVRAAAPLAAESKASAPLPVARAAAAPRAARQIEQVDYLRAPVLEYPSASRRFGEQGRVVLRVLIGPDGQAEKIELHEASAFQRLNEAAVEAARRALYKPYTEDGVAQPAWALVALSFQLRR